MKNLYIIRHAKSSWSDPNLIDHDRPLNERGLHDILVMSRFIHTNFTDIQSLYSSSAIRALDYAAMIHKQTGIKLDVNEALYTFSSGQLLGVIHDLPNDKSTIAVVGHNPAATEVVNHLVDLELDEKIVNLPTASVVKLQFDCERWSELATGSGRIIDFAKPKASDSTVDDLD